jgi:hypothetical protein
MSTPSRLSRLEVSAVAQLAHEMFTALGLDPRSGFRLVGEQIGGNAHVRVSVANQSLMNASRSVLIVSACVVGMPCGKPL